MSEVKVAGCLMRRSLADLSMAQLEVPKVEQAKANVSMNLCPEYFTLK